MSEADYEALRDDVAARGLLEPVWTFRGLVVDGRHRLRACHDLGISPKCREYDGDEAGLVPFVVSLNAHRRHMTASQRAVVALRVEQHEAQAARKRMAEGGRSKGQTRLSDPGTAAERTARSMGVSAGYIKAAKLIQREAPDLLERILADHNFGLQDARRELADRQRLERRTSGVVLDLTCSVPPDDFLAGLICADPPWAFDDAGTRGAAARHYNTMSLDVIMELRPWGRPVRAWAAADAYLALWTPAALLPVALEVLAAWGATYKTVVTWCKEREGRVQIGLGHHVRTSTELLLLGTWGAPRPADKAVPSHFVAPRGKHSAKPDESYDLLERLVGDVPRLDLFARQQRDGWLAWGDEVDAAPAPSGENVPIRPS